MPKVLAGIVIILIVGLMLPRDIEQLYRNVSNIRAGSGFTVTEGELEGIDRLAKIKTDSLVMVDPAFKMDFESPYVGLLSNQKMFLSGENDELLAHDIDFSERKSASMAIFNSPNPSSVGENLLKYDVGYLYMKPNDILYATKSAEFLDTVFLNKKVKILKVNSWRIRSYLQSLKNV